MAQTFADMIEKERTRLNGLRDDALARRSKIDEEIADVDKELKAITAYETAKTGKPASKGITRTRDGSRRDAVVAVIKKHPDGISPVALIGELGVKGDKKAETAVRAALFNLKKAGKVGAKDGIYTMA